MAWALWNSFGFERGRGFFESLGGGGEKFGREPGEVHAWIHAA